MPFTDVNITPERKAAVEESKSREGEARINIEEHLNRSSALRFSILPLPDNSALDFIVFDNEKDKVSSGIEFRCRLKANQDFNFFKAQGDCIFNKAKLDGLIDISTKLNIALYVAIEPSCRSCYLLFKIVDSKGDRTGELATFSFTGQSEAGLEEQRTEVVYKLDLSKPYCKIINQKNG